MPLVVVPEAGKAGHCVLIDGKLRGPDLQYLGSSFRPGEWVITSRKS
jgi:hypothetical protein